MDNDTDDESMDDASAVVRGLYGSEEYEDEAPPPGKGAALTGEAESGEQLNPLDHHYG